MILEGCETLEFECDALDCIGPHSHQVWRYIDKKDKGSTGNMKRHAEKCWGMTIIDKSKGSNAQSVREGIAKPKGLKNRMIPMAFAAMGSAVILFSNTLLTKTQIQCVF